MKGALCFLMFISLTVFNASGKDVICYSITACNNSGELIDDVILKLEDGKFFASFGVIPHHICKTNANFEEELPKSATIYWTNKDNSNKKKSLDFEKISSKDFSIYNNQSRLLLIIQPNGEVAIIPLMGKNKQLGNFFWLIDKLNAQMP